MTSSKITNAAGQAAQRSAAALATAVAVGQALGVKAEQSIQAAPEAPSAPKPIRQRPTGPREDQEIDLGVSDATHAQAGAYGHWADKQRSILKALDQMADAITHLSMVVRSAQESLSAPEPEAGQAFDPCETEGCPNVPESYTRNDKTIGYRKKCSRCRKQAQRNTTE